MDTRRTQTTFGCPNTALIFIFIFPFQVVGRSTTATYYCHIDFMPDHTLVILLPDAELCLGIPPGTRLSCCLSVDDHEGNFTTTSST
jgi:hypothetical protein